MYNVFNERLQMKRADNFSELPALGVLSNG
jgi:hypothetical protein